MIGSPIFFELLREIRRKLEYSEEISSSES